MRVHRFRPKALLADSQRGVRDGGRCNWAERVFTCLSRQSSDMQKAMNSGTIEVAFAPITLPSTTVPPLTVRPADVVQCVNAAVIMSTEPESRDVTRAFVPEVASNPSAPSYRCKIAGEGGRRSRRFRASQKTRSLAPARTLNISSVALSDPRSEGPASVSRSLRRRVAAASTTR